MRAKAILATSLGNTLEWFDFGLFLFLAPVLASAFFRLDQTSALLATYSVFAAGYLCRPLGGILFGYLGDTLGRANALRISIGLMSLTTCCIGFLPGYHTIGIFASILFTLLRLLQGISAGGEYSGVIIYLAESSPYQRRGFMTSFAGSSANLGFLFAVLIALSFQSSVFNNLQPWGWRIPFILMGLIGLLIFYYRLRLPETQIYTYLMQTHHIDNAPLITAIRDAPTYLLKIIGLTCVSSIFYMVFFGYLPEYLFHFLAIPYQATLFIQSGLLFSLLLLIPLAGLLGDYFGRKKLLFISTTSIFLFSIPAFYLLQHSTFFTIMITLAIATLLSALDQGNNLAAFVENCPAAIRYSGIGFAYNLGNALFGGTAPLLVNILITKFGLLAPAYYLMTAAAISSLTVLTLRNKTQASLLFRN